MAGVRAGGRAEALAPQRGKRRPSPETEPEQEEVSLLGSPASSHSEGSDSGLSESEESVFSGLEDSGSDDMEEEDEENMGQGGASVEGGPGRLAQWQAVLPLLWTILPAPWTVWTLPPAHGRCGPFPQPMDGVGPSPSPWTVWSSCTCSQRCYSRCTVENMAGASGPPGPKMEASMCGGDEYAEDSSDEEDIRNTVGNVPLEWYDDFPHVGYDLDGRRIYKPLRTRDELDQFLDKMEDPDYWRTVQDRMTGRDMRLTDEQVALVRRLQSGRFGDMGFDPYEPAVDFFSGDTMIHPVTNRPADKRSFIPSLVEKEKVSRLVHAIKMGWIQPRRPRDPTPSFYDLWAQEDPNAVLARHKMHVPAPKLALPGHAESYNPPPEYLPSEEERLAWEQQDPEERKPSSLPRSFPSLRAVPAYARFIHERFERCLDLYLCPRQRKMRVNVDPEDLIPKLPRPRDLQPFPTCQALVYRGHSDLVRCLSVSPGGQWLASGSDDGSLRLWEVATARCMRTVAVGGVLRSVAWNPNPTVCLVAVATEDMVLLLNPLLGDRLVVAGTDQLLGTFEPAEEPAMQPARWQEASEEERQQGLRLRIRHDKPVAQVTWHARGDYLAVVLAAQGHTQVLIHQLSRRRSQSPFRRSHGQVQRVAFHPSRPFLFVASQRSVRLYHLLRQELTKKLLPNCKWVSSMAVHPAGDNLICGSYDSKLTWFDLDLSTRPYQVLRHHKKALRAVAFHPRYPLFASGSDDGSVIVCHGMVFSDLLQNPLLVPVKVLKGHALTRDLGVLDIVFHPTQPWIFSSGADGTVRLFT